MYISFLRPGYLFFFLAIPLFILIHFFTLKSSKKQALRFANFEAIARIAGIDIFSKNIVIFVISILVLSTAILSLSGLTLHKTAEASELSVVLAIDTSSSMNADDISPSRLEASKEIAANFVESSPVSTEIGVISFSGNSIIESKVVEDKGILKNAIEDVEISTVEGTDIFEAIVTSTNLLGAKEGKAIILFSDGQLTVGDLRDSINYANENDVIIHTIAVGTKEGGKTDYGVSKLDENSLRTISFSTDGEFFKATDRDSLENSFRKAMRLKEARVSIDLSVYSLLASIILFIIMYVLVNTRYRPLP